MKPFTLKVRDKSFEEIREIHAEEIAAISGGAVEEHPNIGTCTVTPSGGDGCMIGDAPGENKIG